MSQIDDVKPSRMTGGAAKAIRPTQPSSLRDMSTGDLVDEHRGQSWAKKRAAARLAEIEAELERRGVTEAKGKTSGIKRHENDGLLDLPRLRAEHPDLLERYGKPGSGTFFRSWALTAGEKA